MLLTQAEREASLLTAGRERLLRGVLEAEKAGKTNEVPYMQLLYQRYLEPLAGCIKATNEAGAGAGAYAKFASHLGSLNANIVALRAIQTVVAVLAEDGALDTPHPIGRKIAGEVGKAIYREYLATHFAELSPPLFNSIVREFDRNMTSDEATVANTLRKRFTQEGYEFPVWEFGDREKVGEYLVQQLVGLGFLERWTKTVKENGKARVKLYLTLQEDVRSMSLAVIEHIALTPRVAGALVEPPLDWGYRNVGGGYHTEDMQRLLAYAVQGSAEAEMPKAVIDCLNALQAVPRRVNSTVLDIVRRASLEFDFGDVVSLNAGPFPECPEEPDAETLKAWKQVASRWYTAKKVRSAKYLRMRKTLTEAESLVAYPAIWFAYFCDSRGRYYARSSGLSPQGTDLDKGLLELVNGGSITGEPAERWFMIHGANKFGIDKVSYEDRVQWVRDNTEGIIAVAADPLQNRFWTEADCPVQFLTWCIEYAAYRRDPQGFTSHIAVSLDGTCNGLQNYSALLRDAVGGAAVNLTAGERPRDIYAQVAERTTELLRGMPASEFRDQWLAHGLNRRVTKRTTMTLPYGCTRYAASEFICDDYLVPTAPSEIPKESYGASANFLSHVVWAAIGDTVVKAREGMDWLRGWASDAVKQGKHVEWYTPSGLRVRSEYKREKYTEVRSVVFKSRFNLYKPDWDGLDSKRIMNAVAPNFIHSMDASHLTAVVNRCREEGIEITAIHDDFGTVPEHTQRLQEIIREEFVAMYSAADYLGIMQGSTGYPIEPPTPGTLDLRAVVESPYFFG